MRQIFGRSLSLGEELDSARVCPYLAGYHPWRCRQRH